MSRGAPGSGDLFDLSGKVALVTGASRGLGLAISRALAAHGARVVVSDLDQEACDRTVASLCEGGHAAVGIACDVGRREEVDRLVVTALARAGRIDVLVSNAGIQGPAGPLSEITDDDWQRVIDVNLRSALWLTTRVIPAMAQGAEGSVVLMASIAGLRGNKAIGLYGISKAGLAQLARNLAVEWGPQGVRVNAVSPGLIRTPLAEELLGNEAFMARRLAATPLRRVGEPHEIAGVVVMLASRAGGFITGQNLVVDGGTLISDGN
ncbi:MAG TPA: SDR family oxidoreductase [Burkholderiaceae bacterium]|nr:SDR family oxidoreductase [Burkholderiaceae bacterium]